MSDRHNHTHGMAKHTLRLAFFLTLIIVAAEVTGGLLAHSLALLSDAGHALTDIFGFGLQKEKENLNARAAALHVFGDVGASVGVIVAGLVILLTGWTPMDPILSVGIAALIAVGAWRIVRETTDILLEAVPQDINMEALVEDMKEVAGVQDVHDLHVWGITSGMSALSCHALITDQPTSESARILDALEAMLSEKYHIGHSTVQFECHAHPEQYCSVDGLYCQMEGAEHDHDHSSEPKETELLKPKGGR